ncbi:MAG: hypothetical protein RL696_716 [Actinomycetota bacterium]
MRSTQGTREQLLEVAVAQFAKDGFERTSVRSIAKAAGTSPALLIHYFGTKDALVREAIVSTLGQFVGEEKAALLKDPDARVSDWVALVKSGETTVQFFRQVLLANNDYTQALFTQALVETKAILSQGIQSGMFKAMSDLDTAATLLTSQAMANIIFLPQIEAALGGKITEQSVAMKLMVAQQELLAFANQPNSKKEEQ